MASSQIHDVWKSLTHRFSARSRTKGPRVRVTCHSSVRLAFSNAHRPGKPGDKTVHHTHRFPVTVYVLEGEFTLELAGRAPIVLKAGEALVEPPKVAMTGFNRSATAQTKVIIFYVSDPETPFLEHCSLTQSGDRHAGSGRDQIMRFIA